MLSLSGRRVGGCVAKRLVEAGLSVLCLEQGQWPDRADYPGSAPSGSCGRRSSGLVRTGPAEYPIDVTASEFRILNFNGAGGGASCTTHSGHILVDGRSLACGAEWVDPKGASPISPADLVVRAANGIGTPRLLLDGQGGKRDPGYSFVTMGDISSPCCQIGQPHLHRLRRVEAQWSELRAESTRTRHHTDRDRTAPPLGLCT